MGNCLRIKKGTKSSSVWSNDDEDWVSPIHLATQTKHISEKQGLLLDGGSSSSSSTATSTSTMNSYSSENHKELKIKITRKQLEKLLGEVDVHELPVDQVLSRLINISNAASDDPNRDDHRQYHQRSWRPHLQSIPEVD